MRAGRLAAMVLALALPAPGLAAAAEPPPAPVPPGGVPAATAALEAEAERLRALGGTRVGGADAAEALLVQLAAAEARVWRAQAAARAARERLLGEAPSAAEEAAGGPFAPIPALGLVTGDDGALALRRPLNDEWAAYQNALGRVQRLLDGLRAAAVAGAAGLPPPGRTCPVAGPHWYEYTWAEDRGWGRDHKGEDLHAAWGTPLVAIESGTVVQSDWHWAGGFGVYLKGRYSGDVYYYAHLAGAAPGIRPGREVAVGEVLGWVGATGNADSSHLHLGWMPGARGGVDLALLVDPYPLLVGLCGPR